MTHFQFGLPGLPLSMRFSFSSLHCSIFSNGITGNPNSKPRKAESISSLTISGEMNRCPLAICHISPSIHSSFTPFLLNSSVNRGICLVAKEKRGDTSTSIKSGLGRGKSLTSIISHLFLGRPLPLRSFSNRSNSSADTIQSLPYFWAERLPFLMCLSTTSLVIPSSLATSVVVYCSLVAILLLYCIQDIFQAFNTFANKVIKRLAHKSFLWHNSTVKFYTVFESCIVSVANFEYTLSEPAFSVQHSCVRLDTLGIRRVFAFSTDGGTI